MYGVQWPGDPQCPGGLLAPTEGAQSWQPWEAQKTLWGKHVSQLEMT